MITKRIHLLAPILVIYLSTSIICCKTAAQLSTQSKKQLIRAIEADSNQRMVDLSQIKNLVFDLRYADTVNFLRQQLYPPVKTSYARLPLASVLAKVQAELSSFGLALKIWDAYRPYTVTKKMWEMVKDDRYVANPAKGSGHNRGIAVDVTLVRLKDLTELNMGTGFDNFSDTAHTDFTHLPDSVVANRKLLIELMEKHGLASLKTEWWHFYLLDGQRYELLDLSFKQLAQLAAYRQK